MAISSLQPVSNFSAVFPPSSLQSQNLGTVTAEVAALVNAPPSVLVTLGTTASTTAAATVAAPSLLVPAATADLTLGALPVPGFAATDTVAADNAGNTAISAASGTAPATETPIVPTTTAPSVAPEPPVAAASATLASAPVVDTATSLLQSALADTAARAVTDIVDPGYASVAATLYLNAAVYRFKADNAFAPHAPDSERPLPLIQRIPPRKAT